MEVWDAAIQVTPASDRADHPSISGTAGLPTSAEVDGVAPHPRTSRTSLSKLPTTSWSSNSNDTVIKSFIRRTNASIDLTCRAQRANWPHDQSAQRPERWHGYDLFIVNVPEPLHPEVEPVSVQVPATVLLCSVPFSCS